jgi:hypothetical protein
MNFASDGLLTAEESKASLWSMTSATRALTLQWTLERPVKISQGFWIRLQYLRVTQLQSAQTRANIHKLSMLGTLVCMAFDTS